MDDIIILCGNKKYLIEIKNCIIYELDLIDLRLKIPNSQVYIVRKNGIRFLGYILYGTHTLIRRNVIDKCWKLVNDYCNGIIDKDKFKRSYSTYNGMFKIANTRGLCFKLYKYILDKTGEKFYFNNWNGKITKITLMKNKNVRIIDITTFNKNIRIDFIYKGESFRILSKSIKLYQRLIHKRKLFMNKPFNYKF